MCVRGVNRGWGGGGEDAIFSSQCKTCGNEGRWGWMRKRCKRIFLRDVGGGGRGRRGGCKDV